MAFGSSLSNFLSQPLSRGAAYVRNALWYPGVAIARPIVLSLFASIKVGTLEVIDDPRGERLVFGQSIPSSNHTATSRGPNNHPHATLIITSPTFYLRLLLFADMGFAESYLLDEVCSPDLTTFFRLFILNRAHLGTGATQASTLLTGALSALLPRADPAGNNMKTALLNAATHYDLGNDMFAAFLSEDMTYSCPIWATGSKNEKLPEEEEEDLGAAQMRKLRRIIDAARIRASDHVLEIGTGWGSFAIEAVKRTGCRVTTVTLSREQKALAEKRISSEGLEASIEVLLADYRAVPAVEGGYDKIVSIEMLEAVGKDFLATYFAAVDKLLKREGGMAVFQCITIPEGRQRAYEEREDFINHYIFPGGYLPSITQLLNHIAAESSGTLIVETVENIGGHYARTLRLWREQFLANFETKIRPALAEEHPELRNEEIDVFRKKWEYYFAYCAAGFMTKTLGVVTITAGREGAMELMEGIPL